jgi:excisionase family DNA binding protein
MEVILSTFEKHPDFVSVEKAAEALSVSTKTIRSHIKSGKLPAYEVGPKLIRINVLDLRAFCKPLAITKALEVGKTRSEMTAAARATLALKQNDDHLLNQCAQETSCFPDGNGQGVQNDLG